MASSLTGHLARVDRRLRGTSPLLPVRLVLWTVLFQLIARTSADPDLWGHVLFGGDIVRVGAIPRWDPYSFTSDIPWVNHEWLSEVVMYGAYALSGPWGLTMLRWSLLLGAGLLIARQLSAASVGPATADLLFGVAALATLAQTATMRPQNFSILLFVVLLSTLMSAVRRWRLVGPLTALMALWVNLHGGWIVGAGTLIAWSVGELLAAPTRRRAAPSLLLVVPIGGVLVNPYAGDMVRFIWETVGLERSDVTEWRSVLAAPQDAVVWLVLAGTVAASVWRCRGKVPPSHALVIAMFALTSFRVARLVSFFAVSVVVLLAGCWRTQESEARRTGADWPSRSGGALAVWGGAAVLIVALITVAGWRSRCVAIDGDWVPDREAARFLIASAPSGRMITWFDWGEYVIWHLGPGVRVSMDGRRETVYSERLRRLHDDAYFGRRGGIDYVLGLAAHYAWLPRKLPLVATLEAAGWHQTLETNDSVVLSAPDAPVLRPRTPPPDTAVRTRCFPGP